MSESLGDYRVLASYSCGSSVYGLADERSDRDITLIVEGGDIVDIRRIDGVDYFVFGVGYLRKLASFYPAALDAFKVWMDNLTLLQETLTYVDEGFKDEFLRITYIDWNARFKDWLSLNVGYFKSRLDDGGFDKSLYHVYRLRSMVERYRQSGVFASKFSDEDLKLAEDYKKNASGRHRHYESLKRIIEYLEEQL